MIIIYILLIIICLIILLITGYLSLKIADKILRDKLISKTGQYLYNGYSYIEKKATTNSINRIKIIRNHDDFSYTIKMDFLEKLDLHYIERSNIKTFIPFFNIYFLILISILSYFIGFINLYPIIGDVLITCIISFIFSYIPFIILDTLSSHYEKKAKRQIKDFLGRTKDNLLVKEDILFALRESIQYLVHPFNNYVSDLVIQLEHGIDMNIAFDLLAYKVNDEYFYVVVQNIKDAMIRRGDLKRLFSKLYKEIETIDREYQRRRISSIMDRGVLNLILFSLVIMAYNVVFVNEEHKQIFLGTVMGKFLLTISTIIFTVGFLLNLRMNKFNY